MKFFVIFLGIVIIILSGVLLFVQPAKSPSSPISIHPTSSTDGSLIVSVPETNALIVSPVAISGSAKGWYFEASFPIKILDGDGDLLGNGIAQAQSDWMTTSSVPFLAAVLFTTPKYATGTIVFQKDNPSGLLQNDKTFILPVRFR